MIKKSLKLFFSIIITLVSMPILSMLNNKVHESIVNNPKDQFSWKELSADIKILQADYCPESGKTLILRSKKNERSDFHQPLSDERGLTIETLLPKATKPCRNIPIFSDSPKFLNDNLICFRMIQQYLIIFDTKDTMKQYDAINSLYRIPYFNKLTNKFYFAIDGKLGTYNLENREEKEFSIPEKFVTYVYPIQNTNQLVLFFKKDTSTILSKEIAISDEKLAQMHIIEDNDKDGAIPNFCRLNHTGEFLLVAYRANETWKKIKIFDVKKSKIIGELCIIQKHKDYNQFNIDPQWAPKSNFWLLGTTLQREKDGDFLQFQTYFTPTCISLGSQEFSYLKPQNTARTFVRKITDSMVCNNKAKLILSSSHFVNNYTLIVTGENRPIIAYASVPNSVQEYATLEIFGSNLHNKSLKYQFNDIEILI